jgi:hypothetical protein
MDDIWLVTGFDDAEKTLTVYLTISNTVFPNCLSFDDKGLVDRADGVRYEHVHEVVKAAFIFYNVHAYTKFVFHQRDRRASSLRARRYLISGPVFRIYFPPFLLLLVGFQQAAYGGHHMLLIGWRHIMFHEMVCWFNVGQRPCRLSRFNDQKFDSMRNEYELVFCKQDDLLEYGLLNLKLLMLQGEWRMLRFSPKP